VIAFSQGPGVTVAAGAYNVSIRGNSMFLNAGGGIFLASGAPAAGNEGQAAPVISSFTDVGGAASVTYSIPADFSTASPPFIVDFYLRDPATPFSSPQGKTLVGTDSNLSGGTQTFSNFTGPIPAGDELVATATDNDGNTSAFSVPAIPSGS